MITVPGSRFGVSTLSELPRLLRSLAVVFGFDVGAMVGAAHDRDWALLRELGTNWSTQVLDVTATRLEVVGLDLIDPEESYVIASLHESFADALALLQLPLPVAWAARDELVDWKRLGAFLDTPAAMTISPENPLAAMRTLLTESPAVFESGRSLVVFPQGTLLGIETAFSAGAFRLAERFRRPLLPVVISGSHRVYEYPFSPIVRFGETIRMEILPPVAPGEAVSVMGRVESEMRDAAMASEWAPRRYQPERDGYWDGYAFEISPRVRELAADLRAHRLGEAEVSAANAAKPAR
jgi:1-acyl-sn-glycerol-3-phosphate acyltransferase